MGQAPWHPRSPWYDRRLVYSGGVSRGGAAPPYGSHEFVPSPRKSALVFIGVEPHNPRLDIAGKKRQSTVPQQRGLVMVPLCSSMHHSHAQSAGGGGSAGLPHRVWAVDLVVFSA